MATSEHSEEERLRALQSTGLLDTEAERAFDRLTRLAAGLLGVPTALVSLVDSQRQFFKSAHGLAEPWASRRETPLTHSFCLHAVRARSNLVVNDARKHPVLQNNPAIDDLNVIAYAGVPLFVADEAVGALCVIDAVPREWSPADIQLLEDLAGSVVSEMELRTAKRVAEEEHGLLEALLESLGDAVLAVDHAKRFLVVNAAARRLFVDGAVVGAPMSSDWRAKHRVKRPDGSLLPPEDGAIGRALSGKETNGLMVEIQASDASAPSWLEVQGRPVRDSDGKVIAGVAVYHDVTERKLQHDTVAGLMALQEESMANIEDGILLLGPRDEVLLVNDAFLFMFGMTRADRGHIDREQFLDHAVALLTDPASEAALRGRDPAPLEFAFARPRRRILRRKRTLLTGTGRSLITWHDVTAERDLTVERERLLLVDVLTGIANRRGAEAALRVEEARMLRSSTPLCVALFDIDHFKKVNDTFGHAAGDEVLRRVAATIAGEARMTDTVARWGGEEFLAVLPVALDGATAFCERARRAVEEVLRVDVESVTVSVGVAAVAPNEASAAAIARADERLYEAKRGGRNRVVATGP